MESVLLGQPVVVCVRERDQVVLLSAHGEQGLAERRRVKRVGFRKLAVPVTEIGAKPPSCAQRTSVLPGEMGVGIKHRRCNELTCQEVRLGEEIQISSLVKAAGGGDGKGTHGERTRTKARELGSEL